MVHNRLCILIISKSEFLAGLPDGENTIFFYISYFPPAAWVHGDPRKVAYPTDSYGQFCGQKETPNEWVLKHPFGFHFYNTTCLE